jgi:cytochrome c oxidase subunit I+III
MIAVPTGVQIFCWIATIWSGRPRWTTPMLFATAFVALFTIGGLSGLFLAAVPVDLQLTDTYFLPGHIHYVLLGGMVFPLLAGLHYWFPKFSGRMLSERLGKLSFGLLFVGMNVTFFPFFILALMGMPRRVYTYLPETGWGGWALVSTVGVGLLTLGLLVFVTNVIMALRQGQAAPADPWAGETLEWATASPPPAYNFAHIPVARGRSALWAAGAELPVVTGLDQHTREVLITTVVDAVPDSRHEQPGPTIAPFLLGCATGVTFICGMFTPWAFVFGPALGYFALLWWAWPRGTPPGKHEVVEVPR